MDGLKKLLFVGMLAATLSGCGAGKSSKAGRSGPPEPLAFGYERRGDFIHFEGRGGHAMTNTRIDTPPRKLVLGYSLSGKKRIRVARSVDAATFKPLSEEYSKDQNMVYYKSRSTGYFLVVELPDADVETFQALNMHYATDKNTIWYMDREIKGSDPATVQVIDNNVVKDQNRVYVAGQQKKGLDVATFEWMESGYYRDVKHVYWGTKVVVGADPKTFEVVGGSFIGKDEDDLFRSGIPLPHIDRETFKFILHDPYGYQVISDANGVYLNGLRFLHADPADFRMLDSRVGSGGKYLFLVDTYHATPLTLYPEGDVWMAETILYDRETEQALAIFHAEADPSGMKNVTLSAPPGEAEPLPVPDWQLRVIQRPELLYVIQDAIDLFEEGRNTE